MRPYRGADPGGRHPPPARLRPPYAGRGKPPPGGAIGGLAIEGEAIPLGSEALESGFHAIESGDAGAWRWTNGAGILLVEAGAKPRTLAIEVIFVAQPAVTLAA